MGLELFAPIAWLSVLLLLLVSKCFLPVWLGALAERMMPQEGAEVRCLVWFGLVCSELVVGACFHPRVPPPHMCTF